MMNRAITLAFVPLAFCFSSTPSPAPKPHKPHVLFALVDDLGFADTEDAGGDHGLIKTPNFEELIEEGVKLDRMYSFSWCGPSRSSLLSGRTPPRVDDVYLNENFEEKDGMDPYNTVGNGIPAAVTTIGTKMKELDYHTAYVGKWGAGFTWMEQAPKARGFNEFYGYLQDSVSFWDTTRDLDSVSTPSGCELLEYNDCLDIYEKTNEKQGECNMFGKTPNGNSFTQDLWRYRVLPEGEINGPADHEVSLGWIDYQFLDETLRIIDDYAKEGGPKDEGKPLFLMHAFHSIHTPLDPPDEIFNEYKNHPLVELNPARQSYAAMVHWVDKAVGQMVEKFKSYPSIELHPEGSTMWDNTIMVMTSDNGGPTYGGTLKANNHQASGARTVKTPFPPLFGGANNFPLRGSKTTEFEGGIRINAFVSGGIIPQEMRGKRLGDDHGYMHISDWYNTFATLAGGDGGEGSDKLAISWSEGGDKFNNHNTDYPDSFPIPELNRNILQPDSKNLWPLISGESSEPVRTELYLSRTCLIVNDYKLLAGRDKDNINAGAVDAAGIDPSGALLLFSSYNPGYGVFATAPTNQISLLNCADGCLFNIREDPDEKYNLMDKKYVNEEYDKKYHEMKATLDGYAEDPAMNYRPKRTGDEGDDANNPKFIDVEGCYKTRGKGFVGPAFQMDEWTSQSEVVSADHSSVRKGRGKRGISSCQGRLDFKLDCAGLVSADPDLMEAWMKYETGAPDPPATQG
jgi:arylsulfatase A-like enzyme